MEGIEKKKKKKVADVTQPPASDLTRAGFLVRCSSSAALHLGYLIVRSILLPVRLVQLLALVAFVFKAHALAGTTNRLAFDMPAIPSPMRQFYCR